MPTVPDAVPKGIILPYSGQGTPEGYLFCDGSAVSRETYADLFAVIGTTYGSGNGSTTFNVPNIIDKTVWGSSTSGVVKSAGLPNITGSITNATSNSPAIFGGGNVTKTGALQGGDNFQNKSIVAATANFGLNINFDASKSNSIYGRSTTVQTPAVTQRWVIKY
jgi:microcystin-dependent protein